MKMNKEQLEKITDKLYILQDLACEAEHFQHCLYLANSDEKISEELCTSMQNYLDELEDRLVNDIEAFNEDAKQIKEEYSDTGITDLCKDIFWNDPSSDRYESIKRCLKSVLESNSNK